MREKVRAGARNRFGEGWRSLIARFAGFPSEEGGYLLEKLHSSLSSCEMAAEAAGLPGAKEALGTTGEGVVGAGMAFKGIPSERDTQKVRPGRVWMPDQVLGRRLSFCRDQKSSSC